MEIYSMEISMRLARRALRPAPGATAREDGRIIFPPRAAVVKSRCAGVRDKIMITWIGSPRRDMRDFLFLDRDGVVNVDRKDYVKRWEEFQFYSDALEAVGWLVSREIGVILISNQSALGRGYMTWEDFWEIHEKMIAGLREAGGDLLGAFYCPHRPDEKCLCRKPAPGLLLEAAKVFGVSLKTSCFIGNARTDMQAADNAGCRGILLDRFDGEDSSTGGTDERYATLMEAVKALFGRGRL